MTKYKKLLIILGSIFGVIILFIILSFTLLGTRNVKLNFKNETFMYVENVSKDYVIKTAEVPYGMPIFSVNKKQIIENIEMQNPYIKVVNIETVFPNNLIIHVAEREEMFAIKISDNSYYICDSELKVLKPELSSNYISKQNNAILLNGVEVENKTARVGETLKLSDGENIIKSISNVFACNNKTIADVRGIIKSINVNYENNYYTKCNEIYLEMETFDSFKIKLDLPRLNLIEKINLMLTLVPVSIDKYKTHKLVIALNPENVLDYYIRYEKLN